MIWDAWEEKQKPIRPTPGEGPSREGKGKSVVIVPSESSRMQHQPQMSRKADKSKKEKNTVRESSENETFDTPFPSSSSSLHTKNDKGERDINSSETTLQQGPIVIFACRHLYHRSCLLHAAGVSETTGHASLSASLAPFPHRFHQPLSHRSDSGQQRELVCPLCFAVHN
jgi:vacuolar protein sorting-associated protein 8